MEIQLSLAVVAAFAQALVRSTAFFAVAPPFSGLLIPVRVRAALGLALALATTPRLIGTADPTDTAGFVGTLVIEALIGITIGFLLWVLTSAIAAAGDLIDSQAGFASAAVLDPISARQLGPIGRLYQLLATTLLFVTGGHLVALRGFALLGPVELAPAEGLASVVIDAVLKMLVAAVEIALPLLGALFLAEVALGLLGKAAPQLNLFILGMGTKAIVSIVALTGTISLLPQASDALVIQGLQFGLRTVRSVYGS